MHSADQAAIVLDVATEPIKYEDNCYHEKVSQDGVFGCILLKKKKTRNVLKWINNENVAKN